MGCLHSSCSVPCCCCCCVDDYTCCPCCPCLFLCGCRIKDGRCICHWDPCRKYADTSGSGPEGRADIGNDVAANTDAAGATPRKRTRREERSGVVRWGGVGASGDAPGVEPEGDTWTGDGDAPLEITDPVLGVMVRPASSISQSTGMEPMVSDDSRTPSMITDGGSDITSRTDSEREGVCIDGKFYPKRPDTATPGRTGGMGSLNMGSEFTINNIISVHIANKVSQRTRHDGEDDQEEGDSSPQPPPPSAAPRRLAKIDIKEERKKIMSELSLFKKKPKRRKQKKQKLTGQVNVTFDPDLDLDPKTQIQVLQDQEQSSSSPRSMHISSAEDDSSGVDNVKIRQVVSSRAKLTLHDVTRRNDVKPHNVTVDPLPENDVTNQDNTSTTTSSSAGDNDAIPHRLRTPSLIAETGDGGSYTGSQQSGEQRAASDSPSAHSNSTGTKKKASSRTHTPASLFTAVSLNSNPLSRNTSKDRPSARGLAMSRHFQGQGQQQLSAFTTGGATTGSVTSRPQSAVGSRTVTSAASGMWTLGVGGGDTEGGRGAHSAGNSDQDSVGSSSHGRPHSTYGIRTHSEAVHSLQRWRNLKVNPF